MGIIEDNQSKSRAFLFDRQRAYKKTFGGKDKATVGVLVDLYRFCRAVDSCFDPDPRIHAVLEGRREVILRIIDHLELSQEDLWAKYEGVKDGVVGQN